MYTVYSPYSAIEVQALIKYYLELKSNHTSSFSQIRLMDVDKNMMLLSLEQRSIIFLRGMCNQPSRETAELLSIHHSTVIDKYNKAVEQLGRMMNGDITH